MGSSVVPMEMPQQIYRDAVILTTGPKLVRGVAEHFKTAVLYLGERRASWVCSPKRGERAVGLIMHYEIIIPEEI